MYATNRKNVFSSRKKLKIERGVKKNKKQLYNASHDSLSLSLSLILTRLDKKLFGISNCQRTFKKKLIQTILATVNGLSLAPINQ